jgi:hypothetical protein
VSVSGGGTALTPAQIKQLYESNSNTNAFTDAAKQFVDKYGASNIPLSFNPINLASTSSGVVDVNGNVTNGVTGILPYSSGGRGDVDAMEWTVSGPIYIKAKRYGSVVSLSISSAAVGAIPAASTFVTLSAGWRPLDDINISITNRATAGTLSPVVFTVSTAGAVSNQYAVASGGSFSGAATFICDRS